jgi:hypothetical protein
MPPCFLRSIPSSDNQTNIIKVMDRSPQEAAGEGVRRLEGAVVRVGVDLMLVVVVAVRTEARL